MTPAVVALERAGIEFSVHEYDRERHTRDFGREAAAALGLPDEQVFKTLLVDLDGSLVVAVVPVGRQLSMKRVAAAFGGKRAAMCEPERAERSSGYVVGGISPFGQRRALPTVVDDSVERFDVVYVSGGRRGMDLGVGPTDLLGLLDASVARLTT